MINEKTLRIRAICSQVFDLLYPPSTIIGEEFAGDAKAAAAARAQALRGINALSILAGGDDLFFQTERNAERGIGLKDSYFRELGEQWEDAHKHAMDERCDAEEKHCTCVPILRNRIKELERPR